MNYYPLFRVRSWNNGMPCMFFYIIWNPIFWKKFQGQKPPGRWGIVEHQIPSIKVWFKINAKSHKHPCIKLLSSESKTQFVNQRKQKVVFNSGTAHSPEIQSYRMWRGAASRILNGTPVGCITITYWYDYIHVMFKYWYVKNWLKVIINVHFLTVGKCSVCVYTE